MRHILLAALVLLTAFTSTLSANDFHIIPMPQVLTERTGSFVLSDATPIVCDEAFVPSATYFAERVNAATGFTLAPTTRPTSTPKAICISRVSDLSGGDEAYTLQVREDGILITARTDAGAFYAIQSLLQLLPPEVERKGGARQTAAWHIPAVDIEDAPRFAYRGIMLDPCRHFLPVEAIKKQLDVMAMYKLNRMHWHLTDDQGWRIEIKKYPRLTEVGAWRTEGDGSRYGGFYTQDEIRDVVAYAQRLHIDIVPELELPGHELAAIAAYPNLSCQGTQTTPRIIWGVEDIVMCPGKEDMFRFLEDVIDEIAPLFPSPLFHIGGDEAPRGEWSHCKRCQQRMKKLGYTKEAQLQSYIVGRIEKYLRRKGKTIIGWDEILEGGNLDTTSIVMSWRGEEGGIAAAKAGHHVLMTSAGHGFYLDYSQGDLLCEPICFGPKSYLEQIYRYNAVPEALRGTSAERFILGVQANSWSEYAADANIVEMRLFPRALALAETAWSATNRKDYTDFLRRLDGDAALRLAARGMRFHIPMPETEHGSINRLQFTEEQTLAFTTTRPLDIVYTTDGQEPVASSPRYTAPLHFQRDAVVKAACLLPCGILGPTRTITLRKVTPSPAHIVPSPKPGLRMSIAWGRYTDAAIAPEAFHSDSVIHSLRMLRELTPVAANVRDVRDYAAMAEGYFYLDEDGAYDFTSNNHRVWIDDELIIDNAAQTCQRNCLNPARLVLCSGMHKLRVLFVGGIFAGWPTYWDDAAVRFRPAGSADYQMIAPEMLWHAGE